MAFPRKNLTIEHVDEVYKEFVKSTPVPTFQGYLLALDLAWITFKEMGNTKLKQRINRYHKELNTALLMRAILTDEKNGRTVTINSHLAKTWDEWRQDIGSKSVTIEEDGKVIINLGNEGSNKIKND